MGTFKVTRHTGPLAGLGGRLRAAREAAGMTQAEVAAELSTTTRSIRRFEAGEYEPSMKQLVRLATAYEVTTDQLLFGSRAA
jgi:transcriptional regulator with XRE-family HTH domain